MYILRTLIVEDRLYSERALLETGSVFIVLAEPGAGKSDLLAEFARILETASIRASIFRHRGAPNGRGLVIDAMDEVARTDPVAVDAIVAKAADLSRDVTVFAGRSSEWDHSRTRYVEDCFGLAPVTVRLQPFAEDEQRLLFEAAFAGIDFDGFLREARRMDLGGLLGNPQFLQLLGEAFIEGGHVFTSKTGIFDDATRRLAHEANDAVSTVGRPPRDRVMAVGDEIFAKLLLSGAAGVSTIEPLQDEDFPFLPSVAGKDGRFVVDTRLLKPADSDDRHEPVHRIVAEYCAARYIARRIQDAGDRLSLTRLLSIIAPSGAVRTELRGLLGWLAALSGEDIQHTLVDLDPYAVLANGDPARLTPRAKQHLLTRLAEISRNDPFFRRGDLWRRFNVGQFFNDDVREATSAILDPAAADATMRDLLLELVASSDAGAMFVPDLERIALFGPLGRGPRKSAFRTLVMADPDRAAAIVPSLVTEGTSVSLDLAAHAAMELGGERVSLQQLLALLRGAASLYPTKDEPRDRERERRYFIKTLITSLDVGTLRSALDELTSGLICTCSPRQRWHCRCRNGISKIVGNVLDRYFEIATGPHDPHRLWQWLSQLRFSDYHGGDNCNSVRYLKEDHGLRRAVQWLAVFSHETLYATQQAVSDLYISTTHAGIRLHAEDMTVVADKAIASGNHALWQVMLMPHNPHNTEQRASPIRTLQRSHARANPALMRVWALRERQSRLQREQQRRDMHFRRGRYQRREAQVHAENQTHFNAHREEIAAGLVGGWTLKYPLIYYPTARTAAVRLFWRINAWKRWIRAHKSGSGMLGMAS